MVPTLVTRVGVVGSLLRFPVKSLLGEQLTSAKVGPRGIEGDRQWGLIDDETGKVVSVKRPKRWGRAFELTATTSPDGVHVGFPDGVAYGVGDPELPGALSSFFGRAVSVVSVPPVGSTFEEAWERELKNDLPPWFDLPSRTDGDDGELIEGGQFMGEQGTFFNFGAVHLVTTATTRQLSALAPDSDFTPRRFRPNVVIDTPDEGFVETDWQGRSLAIGDVRLTVTFTVPRCVMTTLEQGDLPADRGVLKAVSTHNAVDCFGSGTAYPCVGVYADVTVDGVIRTGDPVHLLD